MPSAFATWFNLFAICQRILTISHQIFNQYFHLMSIIKDPERNTKNIVDREHYGSNDGLDFVHNEACWTVEGKRTSIKQYIIWRKLSAKIQIK